MPPVAPTTPAPPGGVEGTGSAAPPVASDAPTPTEPAGIDDGEAAAVSTLLVFAPKFAVAPGNAVCPAAAPALGATPEGPETTREGTTSLDAELLPVPFAMQPTPTDIAIVAAAARPIHKLFITPDLLDPTQMTLAMFVGQAMAKMAMAREKRVVCSMGRRYTPRLPEKIAATKEMRRARSNGMQMACK